MSAMAMFFKGEEYRTPVQILVALCVAGFKRGDKPFKETQIHKHAKALYERCIIYS